MSRKARLTIPGALYHIMSRCLPMYQLFSDDEDREHFLKLFSTGISDVGYKCYAWVLMSNHYHLVLRSSDEPLWRIMKPLQMKYAQYHSRKTGRRGPLFMDRYKSIVTQDQYYLEELIRYVHLNPIRAGICRNLSELKRYRWSGHRNLVCGIKNEFQDISTVLRRFGETDDTAGKGYLEFLKERIETFPLEGGFADSIQKNNGSIKPDKKVSSWVMGDPEFVEQVLVAANAKDIRLRTFKKDGSNLKRIASKIGKYFDVSLSTMQQRQRGGPGAAARKVFAWCVCRNYGVTTTMAGEFLGVGNTAVSAMVKDGKAVIESRGIDIQLF